MRHGMYYDQDGVMHLAYGGPLPGQPAPGMGLRMPTPQTVPQSAPTTGGATSGPGVSPRHPGPIIVARPPLPGQGQGSTSPAGWGMQGNTAAQGVTVGQFGNNPYNSGIPLSNDFAAKTPISNLNFNPNQYVPGLSGSAGTLGTLQGMLMSQANGGGPNLAEAQLKEATNRNIAQSYALGQSQPNNAANARNIANNVAGANQQAAADSAQARMQQQLAAQSQLGQLGLGVFGTSGRLMTDAEKMSLEQAQGNQQAALNAQNINAQTSANNQQYGANVLGAGLNAAGNAVAAGATSLGNYFGKGSSGGGSGGNTGGGYDVTPADPMSDPGSDPWDYTGGGDTAWAAHGGLIQPRHYDEGGAVYPYVPPNANPSDYADFSGKSELADYKARNLLSTGPALTPYHPVSGRPGDNQTGVSKAAGKFVEGVWHSNPVTGTVWDLGSAIGGLFSSGGPVPGAAQVSGDSLKNDKVPAMLSPGEIVIPRSITQSDDAGEKARLFVQAIKKRKKAL